MLLLKPRCLEAFRRACGQGPAPDRKLPDTRSVERAGAGPIVQPADLVPLNPPLGLFQQEDSLRPSFQHGSSQMQATHDIAEELEFGDLFLRACVKGRERQRPVPW